MKTKNWIITIVIAIILIVGGVLGRRFYNNYKLLKNDSVVLITTNNKLSRQLLLMENSRAKAWEIVDSLKSSYFVLELDLIETKKDLKILQDSLNKIPDQIENIPSETSYDYIQARFPDDSEKPFEFSETQIQSIHIELVSYDLIIGINDRLTNSNAILENKVITQENINQGLKEILANYKSENTLLLEELSDLEKKNIKVRVQRNAATMVAAVSIGIITVISIL